MTRFFSLLFTACCITIVFSCQKEVSSENGVFLAAEGSLLDSDGNCLPSIVHGTFYTGVTPGKDTAYVEIQIDVTQTGSYSITSDFQDGLQFLDSGFFSNTGLNIIRLKPIGTPILPTDAVFNFTFDSSFCSFTVSVEDSTGRDYNSGGTDTTAKGMWQFSNDSSGTFQGTFYAAAILKDSIVWSTGGQTLAMAGYTNATTDSAITLYIYLPTGNIEVGSYSSQTAAPGNASLFAFNFTTGSGDPIYEALPVSVSGSDITINITDYNTVTRVVTGTFSGIADDYAYLPATIGIVSGSFTATVSP